MQVFKIVRGVFVATCLASALTVSAGALTAGATYNPDTDTLTVSGVISESTIQNYSYTDYTYTFERYSNRYYSGASHEMHMGGGAVRACGGTVEYASGAGSYNNPSTARRVRQTMSENQSFLLVGSDAIDDAFLPLRLNQRTEQKSTLSSFTTKNITVSLSPLTCDMCHGSWWSRPADGQMSIRVVDQYIRTPSGTYDIQEYVPDTSKPVNTLELKSAMTTKMTIKPSATFAEVIIDGGTYSGAPAT